MPRVHVTGGYLNVNTFDPEGPVDPGFGGGIGAGHPGNALPPGFPPIGDTLPEPPPGVWPPLTPSAPIQPAPPWVPPGAIWPPVAPPVHGPIGGRPVDPGYGGGLEPGHPGAGLPVGPGHPDAGLPPVPGHPGGGPIEPKTYWVVAGIPGVGWRYCAIDPSLTVGYPLPPTAEPR
jgi:hypothetical protein